MKLYLMQHGEALPKDVEPDRPLSERGRQDVVRMANLPGIHMQVERTYHSGKLRARQTGELMAKTVSGKAPEVLAGLSPNDPVEPVMLQIADWQVDVLIVGHLPFMASLATRLIVGRETTPLMEFQPGSLLCLERNDQDVWIVQWMVRPELLGTGAW